MKLRNLTLIKTTGLVAAGILRCWLETLSTRVWAADGRIHPADPAAERFIYAFWHECLLAPATFKARVHVLISYHSDGELISQVCRHLGIGVVRGSTSRGGAQAVMKMVDRLSDSHIAITPDGPRGPRRQVQLGTVFLASITGIPIVPVGVGFQRAWRASSWDRFALPAPYSTMYGVLGTPLYVPPNLDRAELHEFRRMLESQMLSATERAERWSCGGDAGLSIVRESPVNQDSGGRQSGSHIEQRLIQGPL
jgi:lysophospholipid acyltransferase (LPLAT)-like uncharacterized protein